MNCVNLRERFGRRYRVEYEESYYAQHGPRARIEDPWLQIIPCRAGHVYPWATRRWPHQPMAEDRLPGSWPGSPA